MRRDPVWRRPAETAIAFARRRHRAARRRALYWSGNITLTGRRYRPSRHACGSADIQYEMAIDDCRSWEAEIARLTGRPPKPYDPHRLLDRRWARLQAEHFHREGTAAPSS